MNPIEKADPSSSASRAGLAGKTAKERSMEKVAESFESFFINNMLKEMGKAAHLTKKSYAEETETSLFYEKAADFLAKKGVGIKEMVMRYLERKG
jgi:Rod binding domain-containing protein